MKILRPLILGVALAFSSISFSQNYLGILQSNYSGVMGTDLNPASFVDGRFKVDINLGSVNFTTWTNAGYFDTENMPKWWTKSFKPDKQGETSVYEVGGTNIHNDWILPDSTFAEARIPCRWCGVSKAPGGRSARCVPRSRQSLRRGFRPRGAHRGPGERVTEG